MENIYENAGSPEEAVKKLYEYAAQLMVKEKKSPEEVKANLIEIGVDSESADTIISNLQAQISAVKKERANKDMIFGALWCIGGIIVTAVTYQAASGGGTYVVAWGAIIFGAVQFIKGVAKL